MDKKNRRRIVILYMLFRSNLLLQCGNIILTKPPCTAKFVGEIFILSFTDNFSWHTSDYCKGWYIFCDDTSCSYDRSFTDGDARHDYCPGTDKYIILYHYLFSNWLEIPIVYIVFGIIDHNIAG